MSNSILFFFGQESGSREDLSVFYTPYILVTLEDTQDQSKLRSVVDTLVKAKPDGSYELGEFPDDEDYPLPVELGDINRLVEELRDLGYDASVPDSKVFCNVSY